jgi:hypothetical protein
MRFVFFGLLLLAPAWPAGAEVVYLANGSRLIVDGWRDADEAIELVIAGGRVRIAKDEVIRIEEKLRTEETAESPSPPSPGVESASSRPPAPPPTLLDRDEAWRRMLALLTHGEALFADAFLSPTQKLRALRWLEDRWRQFAVPAAFHRVYGLGQRALRQTAEAFTAQVEGVAEARARLLEAAGEVASAEREVRDAAAAREEDP